MEPLDGCIAETLGLTLLCHELDTLLVNQCKDGFVPPCGSPWEPAACGREAKSLPQGGSLYVQTGGYSIHLYPTLGPRRMCGTYNGSAGPHGTGTRLRGDSRHCNSQHKNSHSNAFPHSGPEALCRRLQRDEAVGSWDWYASWNLHVQVREYGEFFGSAWTFSLHHHAGYWEQDANR